MGWMAPLRHLSAKLLSDRNSSEWEPSMGEVTTIGLDLAKHVFQVHGVDAEGATVLRKQLRRAQVLAFFSRLPRCVVGLEACATAHYWARELGGISKRGNQYLRRLLINGASANLLRSKATKADPWVIGLRRRRPPLVVAVALANKTARIAWAVMLREKEYQPRAMAA